MRWLFRRSSLRRSFLIVGAVVVAAQVVSAASLLESGAAATAAVAVLLTSAGIYGLAALHRWTTRDAALVDEMTERIASGDLSGSGGTPAEGGGVGSAGGRG